MEDLFYCSVLIIQVDANTVTNQVTSILEPLKVSDPYYWFLNFLYPVRNVFCFTLGVFDMNMDGDISFAFKIYLEIMANTLGYFTTRTERYCSVHKTGKMKKYD